MSQNKEGSNPSNLDVAWKFGIAVNGDKKVIQCTLCDKVVKGGITRLKEHLAHKRGNVASCPEVSAEVKKDMMTLLMNYKDKKKDKQRRTTELEEEIMRNVNRDDEDDDMYNDHMAIARQQSLMQHEFDHNQEMYRAGVRREIGGSSHVPQGPHMIRSSTVREPGFRGGRIDTYEPTSTPESRLRAVVSDLEKGRSRKKQTKIATKWFKDAKTKVCRAFGNFFLDNNIAFNAIESPFTNPLMTTIHEVGPNVPPPSAYELSEVYLPEECKEIKNYIDSFSKIWDERGVTIMCDGWSAMTRLHIINFLIYCDRGTVFHKSVDASNVQTRDSDYYFKLMKKVVDEVGPNRVVQVVTDNESAMKAAGRKLMDAYPHLYWTACAAHCIDLILEDFAKKETFHNVLTSAKLISQFIYNSNWVVNYMKKFTNGRELLRPGITRFATNFVALESIVRHKTDLRNMWESSEWLASRHGKSKDASAKKVRELVTSSTQEAMHFWKKADEVLKVQEPLLKVLRLVDGDEKPTMGFLYEAMDRAKLAIKQNCRYFKHYWDIIDKRWNFQLHHDLHAAGYFFNPQFLYTNNEIDNDSEVMMGVRCVIQRLEPDMESKIKAMNQLFLYQEKSDSFGSTIALRSIQHMNPAQWWMSYGHSAPELRRIAIKVLSQTTSASNCERNWSMFSQVHTKTRNRLKYRKLHQLVYLRYNLKLKIRHSTRRNNQEINSSFNPINLDYIFEEDDPLSPWLQEREEPVFDEENSDWLNLDDDDHVTPSNVVEDEDDIDVGLGTSPPFPYDGAYSHPHENTSEGGSSPHDSDDGHGGNRDGGGGGGGGGSGGIGASYVSRQSSSHFSGNDNYQNVQEPQFNPSQRAHQPSQTYQRHRRGNEPFVRFPSDSEGEGMEGENYHSSSSYGSNPTHPYPHYNYPPPIQSTYFDPYTQSFQIPYNYPSYSTEPQRGETPSEEFYSTLQHRENVEIVNHGTINYGGVQYHQPNYYGFQQNPNDVSWANSSSFFGQTRRSSNEHDDDVGYQEPPRHSFWW